MIYTLKLFNQILLGITLSIVLTGCEDEDHIYGTWHGTQYIEDNREETLTTHTAHDITLKIFEEGNYTLIEAGIPSSGNWIKQNKKYILTPEFIYGKPVSKVIKKDKSLGIPIKLRYQDANTIIFYRKEKPASGRVPLRKNYVPAMRTSDSLEQLHGR